MSSATYAPAVIQNPLKVMARTFALRYKRTKEAEEYFREFVRQAWHIIEPGTEFQDGWHVDALCDHLQATVPSGRTPGLIRQLVVTMPPRAMKSIIISAMFPAWVWIHHPHLRFLYASYADGLSSEHSEMTRTLVESEWYQSRWGHVVQLKKGDNNKTKFSTTKRGRRQSTSVGAKTTGLGGDFVIVDDPHNVLQAESSAIRERTVRWWTKAMSTRLNNPKTGVRIIVQQRVHESDVAGEAIKSGEYTHLNLPMEYEETDFVSPIGWQDPRVDPGELLWPERFDAEFVAKKKVELGSYDYAAQFQQRPTPAEGGMFKRHWWRFWQPQGASFPPVHVKMPDGSVRLVYAEDRPGFWERSAQSWDMTFKKTESGSYVVGLVGARTGPNTYLIDCFRDRVEFTGAVKAVRDMTDRHPRVDAKLIEAKANGPAVMDTLRNEIPGIIPVEVEGSKEARAASSTARVEAGNWYLPHPLIAPWGDAFIDELAAFPKGTHDDQVDAFSQLDHHFYRGTGNDQTELLDRVFGEYGGYDL